MNQLAKISIMSNSTFSTQEKKIEALLTVALDASDHLAYARGEMAVAIAAVHTCAKELSAAKRVLAAARCDEKRLASKLRLADKEHSLADRELAIMKRELALTRRESVRGLAAMTFDERTAAFDSSRWPSSQQVLIALILRESTSATADTFTCRGITFTMMRTTNTMYFVPLVPPPANICCGILANLDGGYRVAFTRVSAAFVLNITLARMSELIDTHHCELADAASRAAFDAELAAEDEDETSFYPEEDEVVAALADEKAFYPAENGVVVVRKNTAAYNSVVAEVAAYGEATRIHEAYRARTECKTERDVAAIAAEDLPYLTAEEVVEAAEVRAAAYAAFVKIAREAAREAKLAAEDETACEALYATNHDDVPSRGVSAAELAADSDEDEDEDEDDSDGDERATDFDEDESDSDGDELASESGFLMYDEEADDNMYMIVKANNA